MSVEYDNHGNCKCHGTDMCPEDPALWGYDKLVRKADQESELGSMAAAEGDHKAASAHFAKMREYRSYQRDAAVAEGRLSSRQQ